ncbi:hypothetical protein [Alphaentomopoxvirus acuprea]|uniref:Uncharacterized protein n=1 Tax=Alphaentomopoxvirus acuprea TaxID=62099 RepID=W6JPM7_9POXV|nr:hypothetical protein BA82_gp189 [Anomala cuprea entomopoxvirus]BAO49549.1 hypothetical protein [Anomala cuprea entomopoxvirus]
MTTCGAYSDDVILEYKVPVRTMLNVQSGNISGRSNVYPTTYAANCQPVPTSNYTGCPSGNSNNWPSGFNTGMGYPAGFNTGVNGTNSVNRNGWGLGRPNMNRYGTPNCTTEIRGNNQFRTCYYNDGTTTVETIPIR